MIYCWLRRDLRLTDNTALYHALLEARDTGQSVQILFIFDPEILNNLRADDSRVAFIHEALSDLQKKLKQFKSSIRVEYNKVENVFSEILAVNEIKSLYYAEDFEPYAIRRDKAVTALLKKNRIQVHRVVDQVQMHPAEVLKKDNTPYTVFTPYFKAYTRKLLNKPVQYYNSEDYLKYLNRSDYSLPALKKTGFTGAAFKLPPLIINEGRLQSYHLNKEEPVKDATTHLGIHLRFGTLSPRRLLDYAEKINHEFFRQLIWREFFMMILYHFQYVTEGPFRKKYAAIKWRRSDSDFEKWCRGQTGYPLVDAGMRQLNQTGFMHNRLRMVTASFLSKHLLIDWRRGEKYFAEKLLDFELASNNGGWQWAAGTGCDAAPYFRIFNPESQQKKFDPEFQFIKKWVPEFDTPDYAEPVVEHKSARQRVLKTYKQALSTD